MLKVFLSVYTNYNLGDDIFFEIIINRYKNQFVLNAGNKYKKYPNTTIINKKIFNCLNKLIIKISNGRNSFENYIMSKCDITVLIGGSMFIEFDDSNEYPYLIGGGKKYYILGSNFGPYKSNKFKEKFLSVFYNAEDVCFREEHSYELFKDLPNVRYASDIVFTLDTSNIKITDNKKVVISVIDCDKKINSKYTELYENKIIELIKLFYTKGYEITLMSYCKSEGDEFAIERIISKLDDEKIRKDINKYFYDGNIEEALNVMGDCQIVIGTRFHANILGLVMNKTIIPIAYSDKTLNVLKDMNFKGKVFDIRDMSKFDVNSLTDEDLNYKLDVAYQKKDAQRQFENLDKVLERKEKQ